MRKVELSNRFSKELKQLKKKYPRVLEAAEPLLEALEAGATPGDKIPQVRYDVYKVRLPNLSANKGKRGGFRTIYYLKRADFVVMLTVYSKSERTDVSPEELRIIIEEYETRG